MPKDSLDLIIKDIRDILRNEGITGMDSINHCLVFITARYLTEELCEKFMIDKKYAFDNLMHDDEGNDLGSQELYELFFKQNSKNCLIYHINTEIKFNNCKFKLKGPDNLLLILKGLKKIDLVDESNTFDIVGRIYELHLRSGTSNAMRDLGQYFTHRLVIKYMIALCDPKMVNGKIEIIADPTMGTGGFLTMAVKYLNLKYKNTIDWSKNKNHIYGFDIDENVKNMASLNLLLETGEIFYNLVKRDTLYEDLRVDDTTILKNVDVILANEPMGLKNIIHDSCCEAIKKFKIVGTKAEPLFLQLFMEKLNDNGRCAVIVPDGVLFNENNLYQATRKHIIMNYNLKKVISLNKNDFFFNTKVATSILFFEKDGKKTDEVEFKEIKLNKEKNGIIDTLIKKVKYKDLEKNKYSLFANKYIENKNMKITAGVYKKISELVEFIKIGKNKPTDNKSGTKYPYYGTSGVNGFTDEFLFDGEFLLTPRNGTIGQFFHTTGKIFPSDHMFVIKLKDNAMIKYIKYYFEFCVDLASKKHGATIPNITSSDIKDTEILIPELKVCNIIVDRLDLLTENNKTCEKQIDELKKIMSCYIDIKISNGDNKKIADICMINKNNISGNKKYDFINYVETGGIKNFQIIEINKLTENYPSRAKRIIKKGDILISTVRPNLRNNTYVDTDIENGIASTGFCILSSNDNNILNKYIHYCVNHDELTQYFISQSKGAQYPAIDADIVKNAIIKVISKEKQEELIRYCDKTMNTVNDLEFRIEENNKLKKEIIKHYLESNLNSSNDGDKKDKLISTNDSVSDNNENLKPNKILTKKTLSKKIIVKGTKLKNNEQTDFMSIGKLE